MNKKRYILGIILFVFAYVACIALSFLVFWMAFQTQQGAVIPLGETAIIILCFSIKSDLVDALGNKKLYKHVLNNDTYMLRRCLFWGADPNYRDVLSIAASKKFIRIEKMLLTAGATSTEEYRRIISKPRLFFWH